MYETRARIQEFSSGGGGGGRVPGQYDKKALTTFFIYYFLVLSLFYRSQMANFKENYQFSRFQRGPTFSRGGGGGGGVPPFSREGCQLFIPIETHITCDFPGGGPDPLPPPLWICT